VFLKKIRAFFLPPFPHANLVGLTSLGGWWVVLLRGVRSPHCWRRSPPAPKVSPSNYLGSFLIPDLFLLDSGPTSNEFHIPSWFPVLFPAVRSPTLPGLFLCFPPSQLKRVTLFGEHSFRISFLDTRPPYEFNYSLLKLVPLSPGKMI